MLWPVCSQKYLVRQLRRNKSGDRPVVNELLSKWMLSPGVKELVLNLIRGGNTKTLQPPVQPTPFSKIKFPASEGPFWVPLENVVTVTGQSFTTQQHHFVRYLESGARDFERFYRIHQPETVLQANFIYENLPDYSPANLLAKPWHHPSHAETATPVRLPERFGPISDLELATEAARLDHVQRSIEKEGLLEGDAHVLGGPAIRGQLFIHDSGEWRVVILIGNHRTAVLANRGWKLIPIYSYAGAFPIRLGDLAEWPGVADGRFASETARAIFEALFRPSSEKLLADW